MRKRYTIIVWVGVCLLLAVQPALFAQSELAATLEVVSGGVEVRRVNTEQWLAVQVEAIVGVGDTIRTDESGRANVIFFADGTETEILPNTEYAIDSFEGDETSFNLSVSVLSGQTVQRLNRLVDANSSYDVNTPGMELVARGTAFQVRVEDSGRGAMLVSEGNVDASAEGETANVPPSFGIRSAQGEELSDVVRASTFEALDAALDGCAIEISTPDDVRLNVRTGPDMGFARVGTIAADELTLAKGVVEGGGWYRVDFRGGFGWILSSTAVVDEGCAGLRVFPADHGPEDVSLYESVGDEISPDDLEVTPPADSEATGGSATQPSGGGGISVVNSESGSGATGGGSSGTGSGATGGGSGATSGNSGGTSGGGESESSGDQGQGLSLPGSVGADIGVGDIDIDLDIQLPPGLTGDGELNLDLDLGD